MLDNITSPKDLKGLSVSQLNTLAYEIRKFLVNTVSKTGGHLASNLGIVELTLALHHTFDFDKDKLVWDVGHQAYVHKILTGRKDQFDTLRQFGGMSGFPKTNESIYDAFNTGHASTSASASMGMARARDLSKENYNVVTVFGDGALTGGLLFEALNDAGHSNSKTIFILNDNNMSISHNVGAISGYLHKIRYSHEYFKSKDFIESMLLKLPIGSNVATNTAKKAKFALRKKVLTPTIFDNLGLNYIGPIDGHDIGTLLTVLERAKTSSKSSFIHIRTTKGKGYKPAEENPEKYHGITASKSSGITYPQAFGKKLVEIAKNNDKVVAITGAMPSNTGLTEFSRLFPDRYVDVGIAEEHAVTMGAGLAVSGYIPVIPIYSTFFQRAYDEILHDVCLQNLHVVLCADHAGIVGADGETHHGIYDIAYLSHMPNMSILSPSSLDDFHKMLDYAINEHKGPITIRYPKGCCESQESSFEFGKVQKIKEGNDILVISSGRMLKTAKAVSEHFAAELLSIPTIKPLDFEAVISETKGKKLVVTIEDGTKIGGLGSIIGTCLAENGIFTKLLICAFPDTVITQGTTSELDRFYGMDKDSIIYRIEENLNGR